MYLWIKWIHILTATLLMGAGAATAISLVLAVKEYRKTSNITLLHYALKHAVSVDWFFTAAAGVVQFLSGLALVLIAGFPLKEGWVFTSLLLFIAIMLLWMTAAVYQIKMRNLASLQTEDDRPPAEPFTQRFFYYFKIWLFLGALAFPLMLVVFYLMVFKHS